MQEEHPEYIRNSDDRNRYFDQKVRDLQQNIQDLKTKCGSEILLLLLNGDGKALTYSSDLLKPISDHIQEDNLINKCIYTVEEDYESPLQSPRDDDPFNETDMWLTVRREVAFQIQEQEKDLWSDFKNELH